MTWHAKATGGYTRTSQEGQDNAAELCQVLYSMGWADVAIAALLGNGAGESGLNPWRWEEVAGQPLVPSTNNAWQSRGYGIFQFTPATKYINNQSRTEYGSLGYGPNFSNSPGNINDGAAQTAWFSDNVSGDFKHELYGYYYDDFINIGVDITPWYYTTYENFIQGKDNNGNDLTLNQLVGVFELCYERPADWAAASSYYNRCADAQWWLDHLPEPGPEPPGPGPDPPEPPPFPYWILFRFRGRGQIWL